MVQHASGASEIDPEDIANADFTHVFRGYAVDEVQAFLRSVSLEMQRLREELAVAQSLQELTAITNAQSSQAPSNEEKLESIGPGTVIDLQSHRLTLEREEMIEDDEWDQIDEPGSHALSASESQPQQGEAGPTPVLPFPSAARPQRRALIEELFARLGDPEMDDIEWAREVLIRTGEIPVITQSPYASLHDGAATIADHHERLRATVTELSRPAVAIMKRNLALRLESILPELKKPTSQLPSMNQLVPKAMDSELVEGMTPYIAAAAKFGAGGINANVEGILVHTARLAGDWLRTRLQAHLDDDVAFEIRLRAVYREWKKSAVDLIATDALANAFALGLYAAIPGDLIVMWQTPIEGCCGSSCHNNSAADERSKGQEFPSGHLLPPLGPGCRSLVVPAGQ